MKGCKVKPLTPHVEVPAPSPPIQTSSQDDTSHQVCNNTDQSQAILGLLEKIDKLASNVVVNVSESSVCAASGISSPSPISRPPSKPPSQILLPPPETTSTTDCSCCDQNKNVSLCIMDEQSHFVSCQPLPYDKASTSESGLYLQRLGSNPQSWQVCCEPGKLCSDKTYGYPPYDGCFTMQKANQFGTKMWLQLADNTSSSENTWLKSIKDFGHVAAGMTAASLNQPIPPS